MIPHCSSGGNGGQPVCQNTFNTAPTSTSPTGTTSFGWANQAGTAFPNSQATISPTTDFDPGAAVLLANIPLPNADPTATGGFNYLSPQNINQNGWMWRTRGDYNISDTNKVYATYQIQKETDNVPVHLWWQPSNSIPFPGGMASHDNSRTITGHFLHVFGPTLTNDFSTALGYINYPLVRNSKTSWALSTGGVAGTPYPYKGPYPSKSLMMPDIGDGYWLAGIPQMIQPDIFSNGGNFVWEKWNYSFEDNVTKSYKTHTFKAGFYYERTTNNQGAFTDYNGHIEAAVGFSGAVPFNNCNPVSSGGTTTYSTCGSNNPLASLLLGVGSYDQVNKSALDNLWYPTYSAFLQDDWKVTKRLTLNLGLRGDHLGAWRPSNSFGVATWTGDLNTPVAGFDWKGRNSRIPLSGRDISAITWEPRFGLAYNLFGDGKTVLRGGWGEYGYRDQWNDYATPADLSQGVIQYNSGNPVTQSFVNGLNGTLPTTGTCGAIPPGGGPSPAQCGNTFGVLLRDHQQPISRNYNFTISQQLPLNSLLEVGYVGSESLYGDLSGNTGALDIKNLNVVPLGAMFTAAGCTPLQATAGCSFSATQNSLFPYFNSFGTSDVGVVRHLAKTNYHGLQMSWVRQTGRITYNLNYTWSKALGTQGTGQLNGLAPDATNLGHDYGVLSIDRSHVINLSYVFQTGNPVKGNAFLGYLVNGWNLSGITTWQSGPDITTLSSTNLGLGGTGPAFDTGTTDASGNEVFNTYGISNLNYIGTPNANLQPTVTCNPTKNLAAHQYYNANCFSLPGGGQNGPWQLPYIHGPAYFNSDLALFKQFRITERQGIEFRVSAFNFLNHPLDSFQNNGDNKLTYNYTCATGPCTNGTGTYTLTNAPVGKYVLNGSNIATGYASTRFGRRVMEFSAKYTF